ncbi:MAG: S1 family serine peptidase [Pseudobdellovibrionaceae bacterium]
MKKFVRVLAIVVLSLTSYHSFASTRGLPDKIVGGIDAAVGEFPFIVSLQDDKGHFCGGSLIRKNWVLTAAHCTGLTIGTVVAGLYDRTDLSNAESIKPKRIIVHPKYNADTTDYDFALIELSQDSRFPPVELNTTEINIPNDYSEMATVAGWGSTQENSPDLPTRLQKVDVPLVTRNSCNKSYNGAITDRMLCAGFPNGGKDSCQGDSGGPLVMTGSQNQRYLIGVVSWGNGCARPNEPGVYSKVNKAVPWIRQTLSQ